MKAGDLVKMKGPEVEYRWRPGYGTGVGVVIKGPHRQERTMRGCTVLWGGEQKLKDVPEDWLEVISC